MQPCLRQLRYTSRPSRRLGSRPCGVPPHRSWVRLPFCPRPTPLPPLLGPGAPTDGPASLQVSGYPGPHACLPGASPRPRLALPTIPGSRVVSLHAFPFPKVSSPPPPDMGLAAQGPVLCSGAQAPPHHSLQGCSRAGTSAQSHMGTPWTLIPESSLGRPWQLPQAASTEASALPASR